MSQSRREELRKRMKDVLERARLLSVKEPMCLSDRITLNNLIREAQQIHDRQEDNASR